MDPIGDGADRAVDMLAVAPDGSLWVHLHGCVGPVKFRLSGTENPCAVVRDPYLAHLVGDSWTVYTSTDGVPMLGQPGAIVGDLAIAPDGTVWMSAVCGSPNDPCDGTREDDRLWAFGRDGWRSYLPIGTGDGEVWDLDAAPDGTIWVTLRDGLYRIDPGVASGGHGGGGAVSSAAVGVRLHPGVTARVQRATRVPTAGRASPPWSRVYMWRTSDTWRAQRYSAGA